MTSPALVVLDVQRAFDDPAWGERNNPRAEARIAELLEAWRRADAPRFHVRHRSADPAGRFRGEGFEFKSEVTPEPDEPVITKSVNSALIGTDLEERLRAAGCDTVVVAGITTDHCCSTTARMAANLGFRVWMVEDATATFERYGPDGTHYDADTMHRTALTSLHHEFAEIVTTDEAVDRVTADLPSGR